MVTYAQIQRERPGRITLLAVITLLYGAPMFVVGIAAVVKLLSMADIPGAVSFGAMMIGIGGLAIATGIGLLRMKPWARIAGVIVCSLGALSVLQAVIAAISNKQIFDATLNFGLLVLQIWIGYFLLQPSTRELFLQAQSDDERVLKV
jgi:hypothetical protein